MGVIATREGAAVLSPYEEDEKRDSIRYWAVPDDARLLISGDGLLMAVIWSFWEFLGSFFAAFWAEERCRLDQSCLNSSMVSRPCAGLLRMWLARVSSNR